MFVGGVVMTTCFDFGRDDGRCSMLLCCRSSFVVRRSFVRRSSFVVRRSSFVVRCSSFVCCGKRFACWRCVGDLVKKMFLWLVRLFDWIDRETASGKVVLPLNAQRTGARAHGNRVPTSCAWSNTCFALDIFVLFVSFPNNLLPTDSEKA